MNELLCDLRFITTQKTTSESERLVGVDGWHLSLAPLRDLAGLEDRVRDCTVRRNRLDGSIDNETNL